MREYGLARRRKKAFVLWTKKMGRLCRDLPTRVMNSPCGVPFGTLGQYNLLVRWFSADDHKVRPDFMYPWS